MSYKITISPAAQRQWRKLSADIQTRIGKALLALEKEPRPSGVVKLKGQKIGGGFGWEIIVSFIALMMMGS